MEIDARRTDRPAWKLLLAAAWAGMAVGGLFGALLTRFVVEGFMLPVNGLLAALVAGLCVWAVVRGPDWRGGLIGGLAAAGSIVLAEYFHIIRLQGHGLSLRGVSEEIRFWQAATWLHWVVYVFAVYVGVHLGYHGREADVRPLEKERDDDAQTIA